MLSMTPTSRRFAGKTLSLSLFRFTVSFGLLLLAVSVQLASSQTSSANSTNIESSTSISTEGLAPTPAPNAPTPAPNAPTASSAPEECADEHGVCSVDVECAECTEVISSARNRRRLARLLQSNDDDDYIQDADDGSGIAEEELEGDDDIDGDTVGSSSDAALCLDRYSLLRSSTDVTFCDRVGAVFCCEYTSNTAASTCLANEPAAEYWDCYMNTFDCSVNNMPCYESADTPSPTSSEFVTAAPTIAEGLVAPTIGPVPSSPIIIPTTAPQGPLTTAPVTAATAAPAPEEAFSPTPAPIAGTPMLVADDTSDSTSTQQPATLPAASPSSNSSGDEEEETSGARGMFTSPSDCSFVTGGVFAAGSLGLFLAGVLAGAVM